MSAVTKFSKRTSKLAASVLLAGISAGTVQAQSSEALLKKLVDKGILTTKEADDLQKESTGEAKKSWVKGAGLPEYVTSVRFSGDFRGRYEQTAAENQAFFDRNRYRYRLRLGLTLTFLEDFEVGARIASGNPQFNPGGTLVGGAPITANQDMNSLESRKFLWLDAAYGKWTPIKNDSWVVSGTIGKLDNPFLLSNMVWDYDIVPEGAAFQSAYKINDTHSLKGIGGIFVLDELNQGFASPSTLAAGTPSSPSHDPYLYGAQVLLDSKWASHFDTSFGIAGFALNNKDSLSSRVQPFYSSGNTRDANGFLKYNMDPVVGSAWATYTLDTIAFYPGKFPIKVGGEYMDNTGASENNAAYRIGMTLGKAGKKHAWEVSYRYQRLEADAWFDALVDDDNGAYYATGNSQMAGTGKASGWFGGTNVRGHQVSAIYSITDFLNFALTYYNNDLIIETPGQKSNSQHFMADLNWKF